MTFFNYFPFQSINWDILIVFQLTTLRRPVKPFSESYQKVINFVYHLTGSGNFISLRKNGIVKSKSYSKILMQHSCPKAYKNGRRENFLRFTDLLIISVFLGICIALYLYTVANRRLPQALSQPDIQKLHFNLPEWILPRLKQQVNKTQLKISFFKI